MKLPNPLPAAKRLLENAPPASGTQAEITVTASASRSFGWAEGRPHHRSASTVEGYCFRVLKDGAQGMSTASSAPSDPLKAWEAAHAIASFAPRDPHRAFAPPVAFSGPGHESVTAPMDGDAVMEMLRSVEKAALAVDRRVRKVVRLQYADDVETRAIANSLGLAAGDTSSAASFSVEILAEDGGLTEAAWDGRSHRDAAALDPMSLALDAARHGVRLLGAGPMPSGCYTAVVTPRVGAQLLGLLSEALSAEAVERGRSFLSGAKGRPIASPCVRLVDDPHLASGVGGGPFDDEGVPREAFDVVSDGVLMDYFFDIRSARAAGRASNGRARKAALSAPARPSPSNFFAAPGADPVGALRGAAREVFEIHDVMGLHMADPLTGEFSLGAMGYLYRGGEFLRAVRGVTVAGRVGDLLKSVVRFGTDFTWFGSTGSPSWLVENLTVAGS